MRGLLAVLALAASLARATTDGLTDVVQWDNHSLLVNGERVYIYSGEFHYWRIPVPELYLDVFQKVKAAGFNTVSVYFHWGFHSASFNETDFTNGAHDVQKVFDASKKAGLWLVARSGPYINAETTSGGFPGYLTNVHNVRTSEYQYYWASWVERMGTIIAQNQITRGGVVILNQIENEYRETIHRSNSTQVIYMEQLEQAFRDVGVVVPFTHNDVGMTGSWSVDYADVGGAVNVYGVDSYPAGFDCSNPLKGFQVVTNYRDYLRNVSRSQPFYTPEFQGGSFDPWGGAGFEKCLQLVGSNFTNVFYKNMIAQGLVMQSYYMIFGGTNWGQLAAPVVYTSYDYGAPLSENRIIRDKMNEIKLQTLFVRVSPDLLTAQVGGNGTNYTSTDRIFTTELVSPESQAHYYIVRHNTSNDTSQDSFSLKVAVDSTIVTIPRFGSAGITLSGRESKILVSSYSVVDSNHTVLYSTAEIFTSITVNGQVYLIFYADEGAAVEVCITTNMASVPVQGSCMGQNMENGQVTFTYTQTSEKAVAMLEDMQVWLVSRKEAYSAWTPIIDTGYIPNPSPSQVALVVGPYLVRNATVAGNCIYFTGDTSEPGTAEFLVPSSVSTIYWNGQQVNVSQTAYGTWAGPLPGPNMPSLTMDLSDDWKQADSFPEKAADYDDSRWVVANETTTSNVHKPGSTPVLYADDYGFHQGSLIYRGRFDGSASEVELHVAGGNAFAFSTWLNGDFVYSYVGNASSVTSETFNVTILLGGTNMKASSNVLVVLQDQHGHNESSSTDSPRGILYAGLRNASFTSWKIQGNAGGEQNIDPVRGPFNEGGLYGERMGYHLPGFDDSSWAEYDTVPNISAPGVFFYRKHVPLSIDLSLDVPMAVQFPDISNSSNYRVQLFVNGYQFGEYVSNIGPQTSFVLPQGILNYRGDNIFALSVWAQDLNGVAFPAITLSNENVFLSGYNFGDVDGAYLQPGWSSDRLQYA